MIRSSSESSTHRESKFRQLLGHAAFLGLVEFLFTVAPERLDVIAPPILKPGRLSSAICETILRKGGQAIRAEDRRELVVRCRPWTGSQSRSYWSSDDPDALSGRSLEVCRKLLDPVRQPACQWG